MQRVLIKITQLTEDVPLRGTAIFQATSQAYFEVDERISCSCWINTGNRASRPIRWQKSHIRTAHDIPIDVHRRRGSASLSSTRSRPMWFLYIAKRLVALVSHAFPRRKSRILSMGRWMDENGRGGGRRRGGVCPRERNGTALRNFARRRPTGKQTRAMDEMLTRRETIDYSRQDRTRQVGREMVFLYQSGLRRLRATLIEIREAHLFPVLRYAGPKKSQERFGSNLLRAIMPLAF